MGLYTVLRLHPKEPFIPTERFLRELFAKMEVADVAIAAGENPDPVWTRLRKAILPRMVETSGGKSVFFESGVSLDRALQLWRDTACANVHLSLGDGGWSARVNDECRDLVPGELAQDFVPWDASIGIGPWRAHDYDSGEVVADGSFEISKSYNGCPTNAVKYAEAFARLPAVVDMLAFLEQRTTSPWQTTCELT